MTTARSHRLIAVSAAAGLVLGALSVLGTGTALATEPAAGDWVVGNSDPLGAGEHIDPYQSYAQPAGPFGTLITRTRVVPSVGGGITNRADVGLLPAGMDVAPSWANPWPNVHANDLILDADPVTGDAVAVLSGYASGTPNGPVTSSFVEFSAETEEWTPPRTLDFAPTSIAVRDGQIHAAVALTETDEEWPMDTVNAIEINEWAIGEDPADATTETVGTWTLPQATYPAASYPPVSSWPQVLAGPDGVVRVMWRQVARDFGGDGPPSYTYAQSDPRSVVVSLMTSRLDAIDGWTDPEQIVASHARKLRFFVLNDVEQLLVVTMAEEVATPGTSAANYTDTTYAWANRTTPLSGADPLITTTLATTGVLLPTDEAHFRRGIGMRTGIPGVITEFFLPDAAAPGGLRSFAPPTDLWRADMDTDFGRSADGAVWGIGTCAEPPTANCVAKWDPDGEEPWTERTRVASSVASRPAQFVADDSAVDGVVLHALTDSGGASMTTGRIYRVVADDIGPDEPELIAPLAPVGLKAKSRSAGVSLSWTPRSNPGVSAPTTGTVVTVSPATTKGKSWFALSASARSASIGNLRNGTTYTFRVQSDSDVGASATSAPVRVKPIGSPARPTKLKATKKAHGKTKLTWKSAKSTAGNPVTGYKIYIKGKLVKTLKSRTTKSWTHGGEKKGRTYTYKVYAYNSLGKSTTAAKVTKKRR